MPLLLLPLRVEMLGGLQPWGCSLPQVLGTEQGVGEGTPGGAPTFTPALLGAGGQMWRGRGDPHGPLPTHAGRDRGSPQPSATPRSSLSPTHTPWVPSPGGLHPEVPKLLLTAPHPAPAQGCSAGDSDGQGVLGGLQTAPIPVSPPVSGLPLGAVTHGDTR